MAKKKSRSANVARKREKRNRVRKSKQKKLAAEKQRKPTYGKMDDERLQMLLMQTDDLFEEPEIKNLRFDLELMNESLLRVVLTGNLHKKTETDEQDKQTIISDPHKLINNDVDESVYMNDFYDKLNRDVFVSLITPKFLRSLISALKTCENRLKQIGNRERAEVAFVAQTLFEVAPPDVFVEHPVIQNIGIETLRQIVENPLDDAINRPIIRKHLSTILQHNITENQDEQISDMYSEDLALETVSAEPYEGSDENTSLQHPDNQNPIQELPAKPSLDSLPAKAIYKNFDGLAIKEVLKEMNENLIDLETAKQLDFFSYDQKLCMTITENRVHLHAHSEERLTEAMKQLESHCQSAIMYLAKTYEEGGNTDATE